MLSRMKRKENPCTVLSDISISLAIPTKQNVGSSKNERQNHHMNNSATLGAFWKKMDLIFQRNSCTATEAVNNN